MKKKQIILENGKNYNLFGLLRVPSKKIKAVILISGDINTTQKDYRIMAENCVNNGYATLTFDYRNTGLSAGQLLNGSQIDLLQWSDDISTSINWLTAIYPQNKLIYIGHGIAGKLMAMAENNDKISHSIFLDSEINCHTYHLSSEDFTQVHTNKHQHKKRTNSYKLSPNNLISSIRKLKSKNSIKSNQKPDIDRSHLSYFNYSNSITSISSINDNFIKDNNSIKIQNFFPNAVINMKLLKY